MPFENGTISVERQVGSYNMGRTLGKGVSGKVKLGTRRADGLKVALKFIDREKLEVRQYTMLAREVAAMQRLDHPHIVNLLQVEESVSYPRKRGGHRECVMLVLELSAGGELFDYLMHTGPFEEALARTYFRQLLAGLELCHAQGIYHRDLKPENLLLDESFGLKLADFGLASVNADPNDLCATECGTKSYMGPEVMSRAPYDGAKADIWSAGVVLFIMLAGNPPFGVAAGNDWWYRACLAGRHDKFWQAHLRTCPDFPPLAQEFLTSVFQVDPTKRATIEQLWAHPWLAGDYYEAPHLAAVMAGRQVFATQAKQKELVAAQAKKRMGGGGGFDPHAASTVRSVGATEEEAAEAEGARGLRARFFADGSAGELLSRLKAACEAQGATAVFKESGAGQRLNVVLADAPADAAGAEDFEAETLPALLCPPAPSAVAFTATVAAAGGVRCVELVRTEGDPLAFACFLARAVAPAFAPAPALVSPVDAAAAPVTASEDVF